MMFLLIKLRSLTVCAEKELVGDEIRDESVEFHGAEGEVEGVEAVIEAEREAKGAEEHR